MRQTFSKKEKLKSKKDIDLLFSKGKSLTAFPLKLIYVATEIEDFDMPFKVGVSVSKRLFKRAVDRNRIKRLLREAYRLNKQIIYEAETNKQYAMMFLYLGKEMPDFKIVEERVVRLLTKYNNDISNKEG